ncbi:hypothetical protein A9G00_25935 [Achromobacter xylosoxidans]|nr:hypothetical protein A7P23_16000 [Achromobacter xylosoxidans]ODA00410.1 hypothetical protein A9G00_25935 [Achromobacter xylosoxidans]
MAQKLAPIRAPSAAAARGTAGRDTTVSASMYKARRRSAGPNAEAMRSAAHQTDGGEGQHVRRQRGAAATPQQAVRRQAQHGHGDGAGQQAQQRGHEHPVRRFAGAGEAGRVAPEQARLQAKEHGRPERPGQKGKWKSCHSAECGAGACARRPNFCVRRS